MRHLDLLLKISFKDNWMKELDPDDIAGSSKGYPTNPTKNQKPNYQEQRHPYVGKSTKEIEKRTMFDHEDVKHSTRTERPVNVGGARY